MEFPASFLFSRNKVRKRCLIAVLIENFKIFLEAEPIIPAAAAAECNQRRLTVKTVAEQQRSAALRKE